MIRVLVADDQALVRAGLTSLLDGEPDIEGEGPLARMMPKLGVRSRLHAAVWAYQNGVVATRG